MMHLRGAGAPKPRSATAALLAIPLVLSLALPAIAQQPDDDARVFAERVEVRVVNVEVVVTDRQGNRITGLGPEDFELIVDGEPTPIEYFTEVRGGRAAEVEEAGPGQVPGVAAGEPVGTSYLVFVDEFFAEPRDLDRVLERLQQQLGFLAPEDRMAIVAYDGRSLDMLSTWSQSQRELESVLREARGRPALGLQRRVERRQMDDAITPLEETGNLASARLDTRLTLEERYWAEKLEDQLQRSVAAATSTLRSFAAPPGRKVMLLLAGGWPWSPVDFVVNDLQRLAFETDIDTGQELFEPLVDTANLLGYTIYAVDVPGQYFTGLVEADVSRAPTPGLETFTRETDLHQSLQFVAESTGGRALINARRDEVFEAVVEDTRSYYWLGFTPERRGDDQRHEVEVRVRDPQLRVRSRQDFFDFSRKREITMAVESALYFGAPPSTRPLLAQVGKPDKGGMRRMQVPLTIAIPTAEVSFLQVGPELYRAELELRVAVIDEQGATPEEIPVIPLVYELSSRPDPDKYLRYDTRLKMRRRDHDVVVAVFDPVTGNILSTSLEVRPQ